MLNMLFIDSTASLSLLDGKHRLDIVFISIITVLITSCFSMHVAGIAQKSHTSFFKHIALLTGSIALGIGVWSMHFIGMMAFEINTHVHYDPLITIMSILPAISAAWIALEIPTRNNVTQSQLFVGAVLMGLGIGAMHYSGMAAMHMDPLLRYDPEWFAASIGVAVVLSWLAIWLRFGLQQSVVLTDVMKTILSGSVMGISAATTHYVAMSSSRFIGHEIPGYKHVPDMSLVIYISIAALTFATIVLSINL